jgi:hypothetical protein
MVGDWHDDLEAWLMLPALSFSFAMETLRQLSYAFRGRVGGKVGHHKVDVYGLGFPVRNDHIRRLSHKLGDGQHGGTCGSKSF